MKRDIRKAVEEIKSAGMEEFLHQDPSSFEYDEEHSNEDCECHNDCDCPRTHCTHIKKFTFVTKITRVKKCTFVTKVTRVKKCKLVTKCVRFEKKFFWTKRWFCKKSVFYRDHDCDHRKDSFCDDHNHSSCDECDDNKHLSRKRKKFDHFWYKKRNR